MNPERGVRKAPQPQTWRPHTQTNGRRSSWGASVRLTTAPELARTLGLDPKWLRQLIRTHRLVPSHPHGARYELDGDDVARVTAHPAVKQAVENRRRRKVG